MTQRFHVQNVLRGYRESSVLIACAELRIFETLASQPQTSAALAVALGAAPASLERLLNTAAAHGWLTKENGVFAIAEDSRAVLAPDGDEYLGNLIRREGAFFRRWAHLAEAARTGRRPQENTRDERAGDWVRGFQMALLDVARHNAPYVVKALAPQFTKPGLRLIDVGGGHGGYAHALARQYECLAEVFDLPASAEVARTLVPPDVKARISIRGGDYRTDDLGTGWQVALLFGVLVSTPEPEALALLGKLKVGLAPGGTLVIRGNYLNDDGAGPADTTLFDLHMLLSTDAGGLQTFGEMRRWLTTSGFSDVRVVSLGTPEGGNLILATA